MPHLTTSAAKTIGILISLNAFFVIHYSILLIAGPFAQLSNKASIFGGFSQSCNSDSNAIFGFVIDAGSWTTAHIDLPLEFK